MDVAFISTFFLSFPAAFLADLAAHHRTTAIAVTGILARATDGRLDAWLMNGQTGRGAGGPAAATPGGAVTGRTAPERDDQIIGNFTLSVADDLRGWPLVTTIVREPAQLTLDVLAEPKPRTNVQRDPNDAYQREIEGALKVDGRDEAIAAWNFTQPEARRQWWAWFPAFGAWWIMMFASAGITIQLLRFGSLWLTGARLKREYLRRAEGKCVKCGYDMTGLEFNEKCPECGAKVW